MPFFLVLYYFLIENKSKIENNLKIIYSYKLIEVIGFVFHILRFTFKILKNNKITEKRKEEELKCCVPQ